MTTTGITQRLILLMIGAALVCALVLGCGPVAQSPAESSAGIQSPTQPQFAQAPVTNPQNNFSPQEADPTPTPTPMPTACVTFEDVQGVTTDTCFIEPTPLPERFDKMGTEIFYAVIAMEEQAQSPSGASESAAEIKYVRIYYQGAEDGAVIAKWLKGRGIVFDQSEEGFVIYAYIPVAAAVALSELEEVSYIDTIQTTPTTESESGWEECGPPINSPYC